MSAASPTTQLLLSSTNTFFNALASNTSPITLLSYFSTTKLVTLQHAPATCPHPHTSRLTGLNAIRSYFDLLATHWTRTDMRIHSAQVDSSAKQVVVAASVTWMWKKSRKSFTEDFTCTLQFDDSQKIVDFLVCTNSGPGTCVMRAVDAEPQTLNKTAVQVNM